MKRETTSPGIGSGESYRRIREALREEKNQRWGGISKIEADLGVSDGYLAKVCRGEWNEAFVEQVAEIGAAMAAGLEAGIF